jgi:poly(hydroxyalkanoate) depolymerase family esterase
MRTLSVAIALALAAAAAPAAAGTTSQVASFGSNPGALAMWKFVPTTPSAMPGLIVVMHGCTQDHVGIANSGWNALADQHGFYVVYPEQSTSNNPVRCFNWAGEYGDPANLVRGQGENQSIKQMVDKMVTDHGIDPDKVFAAGFSSGGAMAAVMMATWPDVFAAGAINSGIPYRCATTVNGAYACQALNTHPELKKTPAQWGDLVRAAHAGFSGPYPRLAIFHGSADATVSPDNQPELIKQWTNVHGADQTADSSTMIGAHTVETYEAGGVVVVQSYRVAGMGHAMAMGDDPVMPCAPMGGSYVEDRDLCAAARAVEFFGLSGGGPPPPPPPPPPPGGDPTVTITAPGEGEEVGGVVQVTADAEAPDGLARVEFAIDGTIKGSDASEPYSYRWQTAVYEAGEHIVEVTAVDIYGRTATAMIAVTVSEDAIGPGADSVDPIPCGCRVRRARDGVGGMLVALGVLIMITRRRRP